MATNERIASSDAEAVANVTVKKKKSYLPLGEVADSGAWKGWIWRKWKRKEKR
jgi:hypothetical protein